MHYINSCGCQTGDLFLFSLLPCTLYHTYRYSLSHNLKCLLVSVSVSKYLFCISTEILFTIPKWLLISAPLAWWKWNRSILGHEAHCASTWFCAVLWPEGCTAANNRKLNYAAFTVQVCTLRENRLETLVHVCVCVYQGVTRYVKYMTVDGCVWETAYVCDKGC